VEIAVKPIQRIRRTTPAWKGCSEAPAYSMLLEELSLSSRQRLVQSCAVTKPILIIVFIDVSCDEQPYKYIGIQFYFLYKPQESSSVIKKSESRLTNRLSDNNHV
jgi:hypothetical protein